MRTRHSHPSSLPFCLLQSRSLLVPDRHGDRGSYTIAQSPGTLFQECLLTTFLCLHVLLFHSLSHMIDSRKLQTYLN